MRNALFTFFKMLAFRMYQKCVFRLILVVHQETMKTLTHTASPSGLEEELELELDEDEDELSSLRLQSSS